MNNRKNSKWIGLLMLVSQVMLSAFVVKWLILQYNSAEQQLFENISAKFVKTEQQYTDSILVRNFIDPILIKNDSIVSKLSRLYKAGHADKNQQVYSVEESGSVPPCDGVEADSQTAEIKIEKRKKKSASADSIIGENKKQTSVMQEKILMQGTELFLNEVCDMSDFSNCMSDNFYDDADTILFDSLLLANLAELSIRPTITRSAGSDNAGKEIAASMNLKSTALNETIRLNITGLPTFLISKIAYSILFAFILLLLTSLAFWYAFRTLKNEIRLNALKSNLISNISHELKTPVSTVKIAIEALQTQNFNNDEKKKNTYLQMAHIEINRLELLIDKIMTTAELETDKAMLTLQQDDLKEVIQKLLDSMEILFVLKHANVTLYATEREYMAEIDALHVEGVLKNLLDNSLKYGNDNPIISISLHQNEQEVIVWVSDNGPGIPDEYFTKVFEKFFRIPSGNKHPVKGYGLGLSYAALVMRQHGGTIEIKNNKPKAGCTFILHFKKNNVA